MKNQSSFNIWMQTTCMAGKLVNLCLLEWMSEKENKNKKEIFEMDVRKGN